MLLYQRATAFSSEIKKKKENKSKVTNEDIRKEEKNRYEEKKTVKSRHLKENLKKAKKIANN